MYLSYLAKTWHEKRKTNSVFRWYPGRNTYYVCMSPKSISENEFNDWPTVTRHCFFAQRPLRAEYYAGLGQQRSRYACFARVAGLVISMLW